MYIFTQFVTTQHNPILYNTKVNIQNYIQFTNTKRETLKERKN